jgi:hypothetical protein
MILRDSINPYLAARAAILLVQHGVFPTGSFAGERISDVIKAIAFRGSEPALEELDRTLAHGKCAQRSMNSSLIVELFRQLGPRHRLGISSSTATGFATYKGNKLCGGKSFQLFHRVMHRARCGCSTGCDARWITDGWGCEISTEIFSVAIYFRSSSGTEVTGGNGKGS